ncbi:MAG: hypothetical protein JWM04_44 [Verrucomicrobiales bacterium]|nr:hypothetical protein [Verrucomicrobiales bacterium]
MLATEEKLFGSGHMSPSLEETSTVALRIPDTIQLG